MVAPVLNPQPPTLSKSFLHSGDLGDAIYAMPAMRDAGGGCLFLTNRDGLKTMDQRRFDTIAPLFKSQDYISDVRWWNGEKIDHDFTNFRPTRNHRLTLAEVQSRYIGTDPKGYERQWLTLAPINHDRILIHRSPRYRTDGFPWLGVLEHFGKRLLYCGLKNEHQMFVNDFGDVDFYEPKDLLEYGRMICGSELFIGNQSAPYSVAEGLKHKVVLEAFLPAPDCMFVRDGAIQVTGDSFFFDGKVIENPVKFFFAENGSLPIKVNSQVFVKWTRRQIGGSWNGILKTSNSAEIIAARRQFASGVKVISETEFEEILKHK